MSPALGRTDTMYSGNDPRYRGIDERDIPLAESLKCTIERLMPFWNGTIAPEIEAGKCVLAAHGNSLRALVKHLDTISDDEIIGLNIPTGIPLVYELDSALRPIRHYYLGDSEELASALQKVADQGNKKA